MFNKLKQLKDLRDQAKKMQNALSEENVTAEKGGVKIVMNGNMEVSELTLPENVSQASAKDIKECVNDSIKKTQRLMAKKMQEMGGFPGLN